MFQRQWRQAQRPRRHATTKSKTAGKKSVSRKKPGWDNTVNDLTVHQLSKEELELRRSRIMSKNADRAKRELEEIAKGTRQLSSAGSHRSGGGVGKPTAEEKEKLHSILEESDRALSVVKDLFGDDPKRYSGQPNVTVAPHVTIDRAAFQRTLLESRLDGPTPSALNSPGGIRDKSILGLVPAKPALNDLPSPSSDFTIDESSFETSSLQLSPPTSSYQPAVVDFSRFQRLVEEHRDSGVVGDRVGEGDELSSIAQTGSQQGGGNVTVDSNMDSPEGGVSGGPTSGQPVPNTIPIQNQHHPLEIAHKMPSLQQTTHPTTTTSEPSRTVPVPSQPPFVQGSPGGNIVSRNQRLRRLPPGRSTSAGAASNRIHDDLSVLQKLVEDLERELQEYEKTSGYCFPVKKPGATQSGTFTSLTASVLASVTKLTHYLKQSEVQLKGEVAVRNQLLHAMAEQQNLMDALTADVVKLQEENSSLKSGLQQLEQTATLQTKTLQEDILELRTKLCTLEQIKPFPVHSSTAAAKPTGSGGKVSASTMTSLPASCAKASPLKTEYMVDSLCSSTQTIPTSPPTLHVNPSSLSRPTSGVTNTQELSHNASLTPTPVLPSSNKPFLPLPAMFPYPWSQTNTQPNMESTPCLYQTPTGVQHALMKHSLHLPATLTPLSVSSVLSVPEVTPGLSMSTLSPSSVGVSPLPLSLASQTPPISLPPPNIVSDSLPSEVPSFPVPTSVSTSITPHPSHVGDSTLPVSFVSQARVTVPCSRVNSLPSHPLGYQSPYTLPFRPVPSSKTSLPLRDPLPNPPVSVKGHPPSSRPPLPPLSLPYSWETPVATSPLVSKGGTLHTLSPSTSAPQTNLSSAATATPKRPEDTAPMPQKGALAPPMMTLPDLSLSVSSLPAPEVTPEVSPSQSDTSSLDIEASLARMSSLARSVLQELAQDRGHLMSSAPRPPPPHLYSTPFTPPQQRAKRSLPAVESSMTTVTSLDTEETPSLVSTATQDSFPPSNPLLVSSTVNDSPTSVTTQ